MRLQIFKTLITEIKANEIRNSKQGRKLQLYFSYLLLNLILLDSVNFKFEQNVNKLWLLKCYLKCCDIVILAIILLVFTTNELGNKYLSRNMLQLRLKQQRSLGFPYLCLLWNWKPHIFECFALFFIRFLNLALISIFKKPFIFFNTYTNFCGFYNSSLSLGQI